MKRSLAVVLFLLCAAPGPALADPGIQPLTTDNYSRIAEQHSGERFLLVFWSVDCPPCRKELAMLGKILEEQPELPVTLVSTDQHLATEDVRAILERNGLLNADNWQFADPVAARLRHAIDPDWFGELPRAYFYLASGERVAHSGLLSEEAVRRHLSPENAP